MEMEKVEGIAIEEKKELIYCHNFSIWIMHFPCIWIMAIFASQHATLKEYYISNPWSIDITK